MHGFIRAVGPLSLSGSSAALASKVRPAAASRSIRFQLSTVSAPCATAHRPWGTGGAVFIIRHHHPTSLFPFWAFVHCVAQQGVAWVTLAFAGTEHSALSLYCRPYKSLGLHSTWLCLGSIRTLHINLAFSAGTTSTDSLRSIQCYHAGIIWISRLVSQIRPSFVMANRVD